MMIWLIVIFLIAELLYFKLADKFSIIDKPNKRSSHNYITRRGGGIIFPLAWILFSAYNNFIFPWFTIGLVLISIVSFLDDLKEVGVTTRLFIHLVALALMFHDFGFYNISPIWVVAICFLFSMAIINSINFMDGINGITGLYALCFWASIAIFSNASDFNDIWNLNSPIPYIVSSLIIFGFYNFRNHAVCFAGDVGSVSMAYLMVGFLMYFIFKPAGVSFNEIADQKNYAFAFEPKYLLLLSVYGVDSFLTILHRLTLRENIFKGHRSHLYQYLVNEFKLPHLAVASAYAFIQLCINAYIFNFDISLIESISILIALSFIYLSIKYYIIRYVMDLEKPTDEINSKYPGIKSESGNKNIDSVESTTSLKKN